MILGIESSCDDSSVAILDECYKVIFYKKVTQEMEHSKYGGVVPELASRLHTAILPNILEEAKQYFHIIKAIAVTNEPGLSVSLISGVSAAKALSVALKLPLIAVNHLIGHIYSLFLDREICLPLGVLLVSGGHTMVLNIDENGVIEVIASTGDDSFGESFDKVAKMMDLGYPGGCVVENLAKTGDNSRFNFTIPLKHDKRIEYSFSGLKNQVREAIFKLNPLTKQDISDVCASFEYAAVAHIIDKLEKIFSTRMFVNFGVVGGASANLLLRTELDKLCNKYGSNLIYAPLKFCSDNALMIARAGLDKFKLLDFTGLKELQIKPKSDLNGLKINNL